MPRKLFDHGELAPIAAAAKGSAYTLTYNTPGLTVPLATVAAVATTGSAQPATNFGFDTAAHGNEVPVALNALQADGLALKQLIVAIINDLEAFTFVTGTPNAIIARYHGGEVASVMRNRGVYTHTYNTPARTIPAATAVAVTAGNSLVGSTPSFGCTTQAQADALPVACNAIAADNLALFQLVNALINDLRALGLAKPYLYAVGRITQDWGEIATLAKTFIQTYATEARTIPAATAAAVAVTGMATLAAGANWGYTTAAQCNALPTACNALLADQLALKQLIVTLVQSLQAFGLAA